MLVICLFFSLGSPFDVSQMKFQPILHSLRTHEHLIIGIHVFALSQSSLGISFSANLLHSLLVLPMRVFLTLDIATRIWYFNAEHTLMQQVRFSQIQI
jgi:hypothetical protein